jgi:hypothetical protein
MWAIDISILWDISQPFDRRDVRVMSKSRGGPHVEKMLCHVWWPRDIVKRCQ